MIFRNGVISRGGILGVVGLLMLAEGVMAAEELGRKASFGQRRIVRQLTPVDEAMALKPPAELKFETGYGVLNDEYEAIATNGHSSQFIRRIYHAETAPGAEEIGTQRIYFEQDTQDVTLVEAFTQLPDGTRLPLAADAAFIKTPDGGDGMHTDAGFLVMVFPKVQPGSRICYTVIIEQTKDVIADHFSRIVDLRAGWPWLRQRYRFRVPDKLHGRLQVHELGTVPEKRITDKRGYYEFEWLLADQAAYEFEYNMPEVHETGPAVWLTTFADWDAFAASYRQLIAGRDQLNADLQRQVDEWTKGLDDNEIIDVVYQRTSEDVRYEALEFGVGGFQPYDCNEVWQNHYGDCKDKSNLACAMLRRAGLDARMALVNTDQIGFIYKQAPDYRQFNHVIVAVKTANGYEFFDPTMERLSKPRIGGASADREVLVIGPDSAEFVRTPKLEPEITRYELSVKASPDGGMAGWFSRIVPDRRAAAMHHYYTEIEREEIVDLLSYYLNRIFPNAEAVDAEIKLDDKGFSMRGYFTVEASGAPLTELPYPAKELSRHYDFLEDRQHPFLQDPSNLEVTVSYELPAGFRSGTLPAPYHVDTPVVAFTAAWEQTDKGCRARFEQRVVGGRFDPRRHDTVSVASKSFDAWAEKSVPVEAGSAGAAPIVNPTPPNVLADFPLMPTGDGQLRLTDRRFPPGVNNALRRQALAQTRQWFPDDAAIVFRATVLEAETTPPAQRIKTLHAFLKKPHKQVDAVWRAWGHFVLAEAYAEMEDYPAAAGAIEGLVASGLPNDVQLTYAGGYVIDLLADSDPERVVALLRQIIAREPTPSPETVARLVFMVLEAESPTAADKALVAHLGADSKVDRALVFDLLVEQAELYAEANQTDLYRALDQVLRAQIAAQLESSEAQDLLKRLDATGKRLVAYQQLKNAISAFLKTSPPTWYQPTAADRRLLADAAHLQQQLQEDQYAENPANFYRRSLLALTETAPSPATFGERLWTLTSTFCDNNPKAPFAETLLAWCAELPHDDLYYGEGLFTGGLRHIALGNPTAAEIAFRTILDDPDLPLFHENARLQLVEALVMVGKGEEARTLMRETIAQIGSDSHQGLELALRLVFSLLRDGDYDAAINELTSLGETSADALREFPYQAQLQELVTLAATPDVAKTFWQSHAAWWPQWLQLATACGQPVEPTLHAMPLITNPQALGYLIGVALRDQQQRTIIESVHLAMQAARWQPSFIIEAFGLMPAVMPVFPKQMRQARELTVTVAKNVSLPDPKQDRQRQLLLAANLFDNNEPDAALLAIKAYFDKRSPQDEVDAAMINVAIIHAIRNQDSKAFAIELGTKALAIENAADSRPNLVLGLSQLYRQTRNAAAERKLLEDALADPVLQTNPQLIAHFRSRLQELSSLDANAGKFDEAVKDWLAKVRPVWYDYVEPKSLEDPRLANLDQFLKWMPEAELGLHSAELVKVYLLVLQDPNRSEEQKLVSMVKAIDILAIGTRTNDEFFELASTLYMDERLPERLRIVSLGTQLATASELSEPVYQQLLNLPLAKKLRPEHLAAAELGNRMRQARYTGGGKLTALLDEVLASEMDFETTNNCLKLLNAMAAHGDAAAVDAAVAKIAAARFAAAAPQDVLRMKMACRTQARRLKEALPVYKKRRQLVLAVAKGVPVEPPWQHVRPTTHLGFLAEEVAYAARINRLRYGLDAIEDESFWGGLMEDLVHLGDVDTAKKLYELSVTEAVDEQRRAMHLLFPPFDEDNPDQRSFFLGIAKRYLTPAAGALEREAAEVIHLASDFRTGKKIDVAALSQSRQLEMAAYMTKRVRMRHNLKTGNCPAIGRELDRMLTQGLPDADQIPTILQGLKRCDRLDEVELVADVAKRVCYEAVLDGWLFRDPSNLAPLATAVALGEPVYPAAWIQDTLKNCDNKKYSLMIQVYDAHARKDWPALRDSCASFLKHYPTYYYFYWPQALALANLNQPDSAKESLATFLRYGKDELYYPDALKLQQSLETK